MRDTFRRIVAVTRLNQRNSWGFSCRIEYINKHITYIHILPIYRQSIVEWRCQLVNVTYKRIKQDPPVLYTIKMNTHTEIYTWSVFDTQYTYYLLSINANRTQTTLSINNKQFKIKPNQDTTTDLCWIYWILLEHSFETKFLSKFDTICFMFCTLFSADFWRYSWVKYTSI